MLSLLTKAELLVHTMGYDKDDDVVIRLTVKTSDYNTTIASIADTTSSRDGITNFAENSYHTIDLNIELPDATPEICNGFLCRIVARFQGNDPWSFSAKVILFFSDGTETASSMQDIQLSADHTSVSF